MCFIKKSLIILLAGSVVLGNMALADGVFVQKKHAQYKLNAAEQRQLTVEFVKKFGKQTSSPILKSSNPWKARKERNVTSASKVSWGECRDYALQQRNHCYKQGRQAYNCERFYEGRTQKCNRDF